ncbi:unknown [Clostridium sp. CAG:81]|nr:unknown [Clostridium sp. CAG:81]
MSATEAYDLDIFQMRILGGDDGGAQHSRVIVVYHIQAAVREIHVVDARDRVGGEHRDAETRKHLRQAVVDQWIVLVGSRCQDHSVAVLLRHLI